MANEVETDFSEEMLRRYPVWKWNSSMDGYEPLQRFSPLPKGEAGLFIEARFETPSGVQLNGYLVGARHPYAFGFFLAGEEIVVNLRRPGSIQSAEAELGQAFGLGRASLLPLTYKTTVNFAGEPSISGTLEPSEKLLR